MHDQKLTESQLVYYFLPKTIITIKINYKTTKAENMTSSSVICEDNLDRFFRNLVCYI